MANGDCYELTLNQEQKGQKLVNIFHLQQRLSFATTFPSIAQVLAQNFTAQVLPLITNIQNIDVTTTSVRARNLYDPSDDYTQALAIVGVNSAENETLPQFTAVGYSLSGGNPAVKNGAKRFGGLVEACQNDGVVTNGQFINAFDQLADKLEGFVTVGTIVQDDVFKFVIIKRVRSGSPGAYTYRMPNNSAEAIISDIVVAAWNALLTSQISRKIGVGS